MIMVSCNEHIFLKSNSIFEGYLQKMKVILCLYEGYIKKLTFYEFEDGKKDVLTSWNNEIYFGGAV